MLPFDAVHKLLVFPARVGMSRGLPGDHTIASCFPARAGVSRSRISRGALRLGFPRLRGDEPEAAALLPGMT